MKNKFRIEDYIVQIYNDRSKKWTFRVRYRGYNKSFSEKEFVTASNAFKKAVEYRNSLVYGDFKQVFIPKKKTVREVFDESFELMPLREETRRKQYCYFEKYVSSADLSIDELKQINIISDLNAMIENVSQDTILRVLSIYKRIVRTALVKDYISKDITFGVTCPKTHKIAREKRNKLIDRQTLIEIENVAKNHLKSPHEADTFCDILETLWFTGMRPCECLALTKKDIDLKANVIRINKEIGSSIDDYLVVRRTKTDLSQREIPISEELKAIMRKRTSEAIQDILFPDTTGGYIDSTLMGDKLHKLVKNHLGIEFNMYQIRHTFSENLLRAGTDPRTHQELMGHASYTMSVNYGQSSNEEKMTAINKLSDRSKNE